MKKINVLLSFPIGASFRNNPKLLIYKLFLHFVKKMNCINVDKKCGFCINRLECKYYGISGQDFKEYPGIILNINYFEKKIYRANEEMNLQFYTIGNQSINASYVEIFFKNYFKQEIVGIPYYVKDIDIIEVNEVSSFELTYLKIRSIIETDDVLDVIDNMIEYYNLNYRTSFKKVDGELIHSSRKCVSTININKKFVKGYVGVFQFKNSICIPQSFTKIGIGRYNYLGGGKIEIKDFIE